MHFNLAYRRLATARRFLLMATDQKAAAKEKWDTLTQALVSCSVNRYVLGQIEAELESSK